MIEPQHPGLSLVWNYPGLVESCGLGIRRKWVAENTLP